jgi:hypothetical protein
VGPAWAALDEHRAVAPVAPLLRPAAGWSGPDRYLGSWHPSFTGADLEERATYQTAAADVSVYVAQYARQSDSSKLQSTKNVWIDATETAVAARAEPDLARRRVRELDVLDANGQRSVLLQGYTIGNLASASVIKTQFVYAVRAMFASPPARAFAVRVACTPDCGAARGRALAFLDANPWLTAGGASAGP